MNIDALRNWGLALSGLAMAAALAVAWQPDARATPQMQLAQAPAEAVGFIVRFRGDGPIARAQAQAARGDLARAQRQVEAQLVRQSAFSGLCFDRFTVGGAEIVLRTCEAISVGERRAVQQMWAARLDAMRAVDYIDANATLTQQRAPG